MVVWGKVFFYYFYTENQISIPHSGTEVMDEVEKLIYHRGDFIDRVFKGGSETRLLSTNGPTEVLKQTIPEGKEWKLTPFSSGEGFEFLYILKGKTLFIDPGPKRVLGPGDFISRSGHTREYWFRTKTDSTILWFSSKPSFHSIKEEIEGFRDKARRVEELEGMEHHSKNLEKYAVQLARRMDLTSKQIFNLHYAAYFHDIGKAKVPEGILKKNDRLTDEEWEIMKKHTVWGKEMLEEKDFLSDAAKIVKQSHERVDGNGYPMGLESKDISIEAKIIFVVDAYDAMVTDRAYRNAMTKSEAIAELRDNAGTQFDSDVVEAFTNLITENERAKEAVPFDLSRAYLQQRKYFLDLGKKVLSEADIDEILSNLAHAVTDTSPFQRAIISLYSDRIDPDEPKKVHVRHFSFSGLTPGEEEKVRNFVGSNPEVDLSKYDKRYKISNSYYLPYEETKGMDYGDSTISSHKSEEEMKGWHPEDRLYVPLTRGSNITGHISVDDPVDGKKPTEEKLQLIEGLATLGSLAITKNQRIKELNEQKEKIRALHSVGHSFIQAGSLDELYNKTTGLIAKYFNYRYCTIMINRDGNLESVARESNFAGKVPFEDDSTIKIGTGITGWVAENGESVMANDVSEDPRYVTGNPDTKSEIAVPIKSGKDLIGVLDVQSKNRDNFSPQDLELLETIAIQLSIAISNITKKEELKEQATRDPLTGVFNRRYFSSVIEKEIERSHRYNHSLALMMTDINNFKEVNDRYSHVVGDRVLKKIASLIQKEIRDADTVVRYGGDEFLVLFPETGKEVRSVVNRIQKSLESWNETNDLIDIDLSIANGLSFWFPDSGKDIEEAIKQADKRMYRDKGRRY